LKQRSEEASAVLVELKRASTRKQHSLGRRLEEAGAHVHLWDSGLKTHAKLTLVVLRTEWAAAVRASRAGTTTQSPRRLHRFVPLYLQPDFGADSSELFNYLTGYPPDDYRKLMRLLCAFASV